jgi:quercetin dioxygenase-like cupin family protein
VRQHEHAGVEFLYLISGKLALIIGADSHELVDGDAIYFDSSVPHGYRRIGSRRSSALVVTIPE